MTTVQFTLPDQLALEAQRAGLLSPERFQQWLHEQISARKVDALFTAMDRMAQASGPTVMSPEELADELAALRAARRGDSGA